MSNKPKVSDLTNDGGDILLEVDVGNATLSLQFLNGEGFQEFLEAVNREPVDIGVYPRKGGEVVG